MARRRVSLKLFPQLYKKNFKIGEDMTISKNRGAWKETMEENFKIIKKSRER